MVRARTKRTRSRVRRFGGFSNTPPVSVLLWIPAFWKDPNDPPKCIKRSNSSFSLLGSTLKTFVYVCAILKWFEKGPVCAPVKPCTSVSPIISLQIHSKFSRSSLFARAYLLSKCRRYVQEAHVGVHYSRGSSKTPPVSALCATLHLDTTKTFPRSTIIGPKFHASNFRRECAQIENTLVQMLWKAQKTLPDPTSY